MVNEDEFIVAGIFVAFAALFVLLFPAATNMVILFTGYTVDKIHMLGVIGFFGGISMAIVAGAEAKKSSQ
ncbi:MAG: hypothetical protein ACREAR_02630 [Nitrosotalea sp.]